MAKNLTIKQWLKVIKNYNSNGIQKAVNSYLNYKKANINQELKNRIRKKANLYNNKGMEILNRRNGSGRPKKRDDSDIPSIIDDLTEEQKREIIEDWIKNKRNNGSKNSLSNLKTLNKTQISKILKVHRTTLYKERVKRKYKYDWLKGKVTEIFNNSKGIYGSRKISMILLTEKIKLSDRTLRHYMIRWELITKTRKKVIKLKN